MKKVWLLKALGICLCICISIFLFTTHCQPSYYSPEDIAIMAAGGNPPWFQIPDYQDWSPYVRPYNPY